jgi:hydroxyethylthiazole kinase-like uncharacterized protein yjeF
MRPVDLTPELLRTMPLGEPRGETDKEARGRVVVIGGSALSPGAVVLAGEAALRAGAGKLLAVVPAPIAVPMGITHPEFGILSLTPDAHGEPDADACDDMLGELEHCDAVLLGPGMTDGRNAASIARRIFAAVTSPVILDAAAITGFKGDATALRSAPCLRVLTPHAGEIAALTAKSRQSVLDDPLGTAMRTAQEFASIIVLKGAETHVAHPDGRVWRHQGGVPGLGTAGSGDVLAGLMAGLVARGTPAIAACLWAVFIHAQAGVQLTREIGRLGFLARELSGLFPRLLEDNSAPDVVAARIAPIEGSPTAACGVV